MFTFSIWFLNWECLFVENPTSFYSLQNYGEESQGLEVLQEHLKGVSCVFVTDLSGFYFDK